jgi:pyruvate/oxaloacetate carboxyltransferase
MADSSRHLALQVQGGMVTRVIRKLTFIAYQILAHFRQILQEIHQVSLSIRYPSFSYLDLYT